MRAAEGVGGARRPAARRRRSCDLLARGGARHPRRRGVRRRPRPRLLHRAPHRARHVEGARLRQPPPHRRRLEPRRDGARGRAATRAEGALLVPLLDARKGEVYAGFYRARAGRGRRGRGRGRAAARPRSPSGSAPSRRGRRRRRLRRGLRRPRGGARAGASRASPRARRDPARGRALAALVAARLAGAPFDAQALFALEPHYVRKSEAEVKFPNGTRPGRRGGTDHARLRHRRHRPHRPRGRAPRSPAAATR